MKAENIRLIKHIVVVGSILIYFILWCKLPRTVGIHYDAACNANAYGHKDILLIYILFPLVAYIPMPHDEPPEIHSSELQELYKEMVEDEKRKKEYILLGLGIIQAIIMMVTIIMAMNSVK